MSHWILNYDHFRPEQEGVREALCALGNGYFCTRGAAAETKANEVHYPGTYLAGCYNRLSTEMGGRIIENEDLVNLPNWLSLTFRIDEGEWFDLSHVEILSFSQDLDLYHAILKRRVRFRDAQGRTSLLESRRLVHMDNPHLAGIHWRFHAIDWSGNIEILSAIDGRIDNSGVKRYRQLNRKHLELIDQGEVDQYTVWLKVNTSQSDIRVAMATRTKIWKERELLTEERILQQEPGWIGHLYRTHVEKGDHFSAEKILAIHSSKDLAASECGLEARDAAKEAPDFALLLKSHLLAWKALWEQFDIEIDARDIVGRRHPLLILRLHIFHLLQTASHNTLDLDVGIPARGWTGEAYRGHIFWDELFIFPTINLRLPEITADILKYRIRRLEQAQKAAREAGFRGAMFPWQSGSNGREETQKFHLNPRSGRWLPDNTSLQRHVGGAIAHTFWAYYQVTHDIDFLIAKGAEVILEIARFFASISTLNSASGRYEIHGVMGPDEYHDRYPWNDNPGINNNAYTNILAVWVICRALDLLTLLPRVAAGGLRERLGLEPQEIERWEEISRRMFVPFHETDIISQFEGYERLKPFPWDEYRKKYGDIHRLDRILEAEDDSPNNYQVSKQADVLMLFYLFSAEELTSLLSRLGYAFDPNTIVRNAQYYWERNAHGSSLSRVVHSWVRARADRPGSWKLLLDALQGDIADTQRGTTAEGIHLGAMASSVDLLQRCYTGITVGHDVLYFNPALPEIVKSLKFSLLYGGHSLRVDLTPERLILTVKDGKAPPIKVGHLGKVFTLAPGDSVEIAVHQISAI